MLVSFPTYVSANQRGKMIAATRKKQHNKREDAFQDSIRKWVSTYVETFALTPKFDRMVMDYPPQTLRVGNHIIKFVICTGSHLNHATRDVIADRAESPIDWRYLSRKVVQDQSVNNFAQEMRVRFV